MAGLCLCTLFAIVNLIPYWFLVFVLFFSFLCGQEATNICFILLTLYAIFSYIIQTFVQGWLSSVLHGLSIALFFTMPFYWTPPLVTWSYGVIVWMLEPLWIFCEVIVLYKFITMISQAIISGYEYMEVSMKVVMLLLTCIAHAASGWIVYNTIGLLPWWLMSMVLLLTVVIQYLVYVKEAGNILDTSLVLLMTLLILSLMRWELSQLDTSGKVIKAWNKTNKFNSFVYTHENVMKSSFVQLLWTTILNCTVHAGTAVNLWSQFLSWTVLLSLSLRIVFVAVFWVWQANQEKEESPVYNFHLEEQHRETYFTQNVLYKVLFLAMCAQVVQQHYQWAEPSGLNSWFKSIFYARQLLPGRLLQALSLQFLYIYMLRKAEDYESW